MNPKRRDGELVTVKKRPLPFSYWPMYKSTRRYGLQSMVFATNSWALIDKCIRDYCPKRPRQEALATLRQAKFFYESADVANDPAAKPLLLYYAFMNLGKAFALTVGQRNTFNKARHGLGEPATAQRKGLGRARIEAFPSPGQQGRPNLFDDFLTATSRRGLSKKTTLRVPHLVPQVIAGHRLWAEATQRKERFIAIHRIETMHDPASKEIWLRLWIFADDLSRLSVTQSQMLEESQLKKHNWKKVNGEQDKETGRKLLCFEQQTTIKYQSRAADKVPECVDIVRALLWATVLSVPPYRRYYVYLCPKAERASLLPQVSSIYALTYYLGTVTRYRPQEFDRILTGDFGAYCLEFLASQPSQFLYLLASDITEREVTMPAIV